MNPKQSSLDTDAVKLDMLVSRIGAELSQLQALSLSVQDALSHCVLGLSSASDSLQSLQGIDRITQALGDLARIMNHIGQTVPAGVVLARQPLASQVGLRDLSLRVLRQDLKAETLSGLAQTGEVNWF
jgi:hypothetical protein